MTQQRILLSGICLLLLLTATAQKKPVRQTIGSKPGQQLTSQADSMQYITGAYLAHWLLNNGFSLTNPALFSKGMNDVLQGKPRMVPDSILEISIIAYQNSVQKETALVQEKKYFASLNSQPGNGMLPNGVRFHVINSGSGPIPGNGDSVILHLQAKLLNGTVVEDTYRNNRPFRATVQSFFPGLNDALRMMPAGSKWRLFVPSALAYGEKGTAGIPANSALILEVEMVQVLPPKKSPGNTPN
ncbi:FKBP-type peptidyl-prolyl cis-trans isomerase [Sediminibacterium soli]|uniref:FKBP-type peptidyl-prolyl cis-trans isomerase n=1 Tax=Sediminibacterium soli TaxID=2698829 RepID=UPI001379FA1F|nr:FKBP-type peptidyl-prolyl cis-trans isomerase [Sediminibacterium soli]NCI45784.1 hypothetical protein [Sediminibacterium soli]